MAKESDKRAGQCLLKSATNLIPLTVSDWVRSFEATEIWNRFGVAFAVLPMLQAQHLVAFG